MGISKRISRDIELGKLGKELLGLHFATTPQGKTQAVESVVSRMAAMHGVPQKIGQILSLSQGAKSGGGSGSIFDLLTQSGETVSVETFTSWVKCYLSEELFFKFKEIHPQGFAASIAQVHRATLVSGEAVALKVQYPDLRDSVTEDLKALSLLSLPLRVKAKSNGLVDYDMSEYREELRTTLLRELDYREELSALQRAYSRNGQVPGVITPRAYPALSNESVLVMEWLEGISFREMEKLGPQLRERAAAILLQYFLRSWLVWGELHADPHPGNYLFQVSDSEVRVGIIDFGCMKRLSAAERELGQTLLLQGQALGPDCIFELLVKLGFNSALLQPIEEKLAELMRIVFAPFYVDSHFDISAWHLSERIEELLGEYRWNFRLAGPASLTFFLRPFSGVIQQLRTLGVKLNWSEQLRLATGFTIERDAVAKSERVSKTVAPPTKLCVLVKDNGELKVKLLFPSSSVESLEELVPPNVLEGLVAQGIDILELKRKTLESGLVPQEVFKLVDGAREVRVTLEQ